MRRKQDTETIDVRPGVQLVIVFTVGDSVSAVATLEPTYASVGAFWMTEHESEARFRERVLQYVRTLASDLTGIQRVDQKA